MNRVVSLVCLVVVAGTLAVLPRVARAQSKPTVAVLGLELKDDGSGIDEKSANVARILTEALRSRVGSAGSPYKPAPGADKELVDALLFANCTSSTDLGCMVRIGNDITTDYLIYGNLKKDGKGYQVTLTLLDVNNKKIVRTMTEPIESNRLGEVALKEKAKSLYTKIAGQSSKGSLSISANVDSGTIYLDNQVRGQIVKGIGRVAGLEAGRYKLAVESDGFRREERPITITGGQETDEKFKLEKGDDTVVPPPPCVGPECDPPPPPPPAGRPGGLWRKVFWGSVVVVGAAGGTWAYTGAQYKWGLSSQDGVSACGTDAENDPANANLSKRCSYRKIAIVTGAVAVGGAVLAGVSYYLGYKKPKKERSAGIRRPRSKDTSFTLTPVVRPDGAGATFRIDW